MNLSAGQELHWDASLNPAALGNGALAFSYDDANRVKRIDVNPARASFQRNAGLFVIAREGCLSGLQRWS